MLFILLNEHPLECVLRVDVVVVKVGALINLTEKKTTTS